MQNIKNNTILKFSIILTLAIIVFSSWTYLNNNVTTLPVNDTAGTNEELPLTAVPGKVRTMPLEKKDIIVLRNGKQIEGKSTEVKVLEIKYLDARGKMPIKILSIRRQ